MQDYALPREKIKSINLIKDGKTVKSSGILISVVIPLFNEEKSIKNVINRVRNHFEYEIILVDDGSTDNSVKIVEEINKKIKKRKMGFKNGLSYTSLMMPSINRDMKEILGTQNLENQDYSALIPNPKKATKEIKIIKHKKNQGYGAAILTGLNHATGDIIVTMDSDGQHNPEEIPNLIKPIINHKADLVIGSRYLGRSNYKIPFHTRAGEFFIKTCLWLLYHQKIGNNQCGFRAFSNNNLMLFKNMKYDKFGICTEVLFKAAYNKLRITEIPVIINPRVYGNSSIKLIRLIKSIFSCIVYYTLKKLRIDKIKEFIILKKTIK